MTGPVAHLNVAYLRATRGDPEVAEFWDNVDRVNALAERWPGFIANIPFEDEELAAAAPLFPELPVGFDPTRLIATLSSWKRGGDLLSFVTGGVHGNFRSRRRTWFLPLSGPTYVVWPVSRGRIPTLDEGIARLARIRAEGPTEEAYDFRWLSEKTLDA